jgi:antitoxin (DNA-binding transcriptional repressor) of toxin-antitoxin stability system
MKRVGVREFKDKATSYISKAETVVIEKHGEPVGWYIPIPKKDKAKVKAAMMRLEKTINQTLEKTKLSEEDLAEFFSKDWVEGINPDELSSQQKLDLYQGKHATGR